MIGSRPGTPAGRVGLSSAAEYVVETARSSVLVLPRGVAFSVDSGSELIVDASAVDQEA